MVDAFATAMTEGNIEKVKIAKRLTPGDEKRIADIFRQQKGYKMTVQSCNPPQVSVDNAKIACRVLTELSGTKPAISSLTYSLQRISGRWIIISAN